MAWFFESEQQNLSKRLAAAATATLAPAAATLAPAAATLAPAGASPAPTVGSLAPAAATLAPAGPSATATTLIKSRAARFWFLSVLSLTNAWRCTTNAANSEICVLHF